MRRRTVTLAAAALLAAGLLAPFVSGAQAASPAAAEKTVTIPISSMVLFTSGVTYLQHDGVVDGNAQMELTFSASQINDLLKSLVVRDLDGGSITSVTYSSRDPITRTLKTFAVDLTSDPTLSNLLVQTRGEAVEVTLTNASKVTGTIISVETRQEQTSPKGVVAGDFVNISTAAGVRSIALQDVEGIRFLRKEIQDDLAQALLVLSASHGVEKKKLVLHFSGAGKRRVRIGYILESPVWKTSYRLVLAETGQHLLQGWALVENTTDTDWSQVGLKLVSGRPITFTMDLYQPLYIQRPEVQLELYQSLVPKTNEMAMDQEAPMEEATAAGAPAPASAPAAKSMAQPAGPRAALGFAAPAPESFNPAQGVNAAATGSAVGELFQYVIDKPVTLPRQQSAMLPILNQLVDGARYSLYNPATEPTHPLNAVRLKNASALHLMQGPITVFDGGSYAGDAQITDLPPGAEQLITYALDLDTEIQSTQGASPTTLISVRIGKGVFYFSNRLQRERDYSIANRGAKDRTVLIEQPIASDWDLTRPDKPLERTRDNYRFAVPVAAGKSGSLAVVETRLVSQSIALSSMGSDQIAVYLQAPVVSQAVKDALQTLVSLQQKLADTVSQRQRQEARVNEIANDQSRIRQNMDRLDKTSDLYKQYVKTLTDQETELSSLRTAIATLRDQEASQRSDIASYIQSLDVS